MKKVNTKTIRSLNPCKDRFDNYLKYYENFSGTIVDFLELDKITAEDKIWVAVRILPNELVEIFAVDCTFSAANRAATATAGAYWAADAYAYGTVNFSMNGNKATVWAATAAARTFNADWVDSSREKENQVDALIMLVREAGPC